MANHPDDRFLPRPAPPRARPPKSPKFTTRVLKSLARHGVSSMGHVPMRPKSKGAVRGRGRVAAHQARQQFGLRLRRVTVKFRLVNLRKASPGNAAARLRYLERQGVTLDGQKGKLYGADQDALEASDFEQRCRHDRHQFAVIVSPDDGAEINDLRAFTRSLMTQVEHDLGTQLEWVAADHFDTGHPHTHIVIRGKGGDGKDLIISRDYISSGMRMRAGELATQWLGSRTQLEIDADFDRQVRAERWTGLDAQIGRLSKDGTIHRDVMQERFDPPMAARARARMLILQDMGLAERCEDGWRLEPSAERVLRAMGERGDIIRELQRAHSGLQYEIFNQEQAPAPVVGRLSVRGWHEDGDHAYALIEGVDGRNHYVRLPPRIDPDTLSIGGIVQVEGLKLRRVDQTIAKMAEHGLYRPTLHRDQLRGDPSVGDPDEYVGSHVRRLEALRRAGIVERTQEGVWRIPVDLPEKGLAYDRRRLGGLQVTMLSSIPLERQVQTLAPTWLDRRLLEGKTVPQSPFGEDLGKALRKRGDFLVSRGLASRQGQRLIFTRNLLEQLHERELQQAGSRLEAVHGRVYRAASAGIRMSGTYRQSVDLVSGRYAMLDDGVGFSLVPWRPVLSDRLGQSVSATITGGRVSWEFGRRRGLSI